jgi:hypothetical protein
MKDYGIRIRVDKTLREPFQAACRAENKQASDILREFMQAYAASYQNGQGNLFSKPANNQTSTRKQNTT